MTEAQARAMSTVLLEVGDERQRQHAKWGEQNHADGTSYAAQYMAQHAKHECDAAAKRGECTYKLILQEEVFEAFAEDDPVRLRAELVQCAAVCVAWVEKIDRDLSKISESGRRSGVASAEPDRRTAMSGPVAGERVEGVLSMASDAGPTETTPPALGITPFVERECVTCGYDPCLCDQQ